MDSNIANHLVQTVEASRLLGATVIVTGLSPEIAQTLVISDTTSCTSSTRLSRRSEAAVYAAKLGLLDTDA